MIGDAAFVTGPGDPLPGVAPVAEQEGDYVAEVISRQVRGEPAPPPFRYRDKGMLATIGRHSAIADFGRIRFTGWLAWVLWGIVHIFFSIGFRNRSRLPQLDLGLAHLRPRRPTDHWRHNPARFDHKPDDRTVPEVTGSEAVPARSSG